MGDTKRRTGRKVAVVRSVERTGERSQQRDRIVVGGTEEAAFYDKIEGNHDQDRREWTQSTQVSYEKPQPLMRGTAQEKVTGTRRTRSHLGYEGVEVV